MYVRGKDQGAYLPWTCKSAVSAREAIGSITRKLSVCREHTTGKTLALLRHREQISKSNREGTPGASADFQEQ